MGKDTTEYRHLQEQSNCTPPVSGVWGTPGCEVDTLRRLYHQEIDQVLTKLEAQLQQVIAAGPASSLVRHAQDNLCVLRACYVHELLPNQALDVLLQHLLELTQVLQRKTT